MNYTAKDIVMIMQRAKRLGVSQLTVGDIDIVFDSFSKDRSIPQEASVSHTATPQAVAEIPAAPVQIAAEEKALEEWRSQELELLNGPLLSPYDWEQAQVNILENGGEDHQGEIEDAQSIQI